MPRIIIKKLLLILSIIITFAGDAILAKDNRLTDLIIETPNLENFDQLNTSLWQIQLYGFTGNGCNMISEALNISDSLLRVQVGKFATPQNGKQYWGGEIGSYQFYSYGKYTVRMKNNIKSGTVSSFFIMNQWVPENWEHQEIDIEFLGKDPSIVQLTVHYYRDKGQNHIQNTYVHQLGFDSTKDFHEYAIHWQPQKVDWYVDGELVHTETRDLPDVQQMQIRLNHWAADPNIGWAVDWLGEIADSSLPSEVFYDWIHYETESSLKRYYIQGYVTDVNGAGIGQVALSLSGVGSATYLTNDNGYYEFTELAAGNYAISPSKTGYSFKESSIIWGNLQSNQEDQNFTGLPVLVNYQEVKIVGGEKGYINPLKGEKAQIVVKTTDAGTLEVKIYNLMGGLVWNTAREVSGDNLEIINWDGKNLYGQRVAAGVYLVRVEGVGIKETKKIAVIK